MSLANWANFYYLVSTFAASNFKIPLYRDILLALGVCSVSKKSCSNILRKGPGNSITIVVGGAAESLAAHPGTNDLTLKKRLGFIKLAVREGWVEWPKRRDLEGLNRAGWFWRNLDRAGLVPVFSFGENDVSGETFPNSRCVCLLKLSLLRSGLRTIVGRSFALYKQFIALKSWSLR
jgi:hypothetical protein